MTKCIQNNLCTYSMEIISQFILITYQLITRYWAWVFLLGMKSKIIHKIWQKGLLATLAHIRASEDTVEDVYVCKFSNFTLLSVLGAFFSLQVFVVPQNNMAILVLFGKTTANELSWRTKNQGILFLLLTKKRWAQLSLSMYEAVL